MEITMQTDDEKIQGGVPCPVFALTRVIGGLLETYGGSVAEIHITKSEPGIYHMTFATEECK